MGAGEKSLILSGGRGAGETQVHEREVQLFARP